MKISVKLTQQELTNIVSLHVFGKSKDIDIEIIQEEPAVISLPTYSEWYTVPDSHYTPNCPIQLEQEQMIDVFRRNGLKERWLASDLNESWLQKNSGADICKFRLVNPKDDWLIVPSNHLAPYCPIVVRSDFSNRVTETVFSDGSVSNKSSFLTGKWEAWSQAAHDRIVKFRVKAVN